MILKIEELYSSAMNEGNKVQEILISKIGFDHLQSELNNKRQSPPEWISKLKVVNDHTGIKMITEK